MLQRDDKGTSLSELALYLYGSTKQVHISLYDGHSESGSCNFTPCGVFLTGKGFENPCHIILTHTDSRIAYPGSHNHVSRLIAWQFLQAYPDRTTGRSIFEELLENSDYISLHCPLTKSTKHLINKETLSLMKSSAFIINTSRGALIDEAAFIEALENGIIAGAGLDVQENEPPEENSPLYTMDKVLLTPHMGWKGLETRQRLVSILADNIKKFMEGNPVNVVSGL